MEKSIQRLLNKFDSTKAFEHLLFMEELGPRTPASKSHRKLRDYIIKAGNKTRADFFKQTFHLDFCGKQTEFYNLIFIFKGTSNKAANILLGTHYDSRIIADNENLPENRLKPIPGINDGGSGTAVFIELLDILDKNKHTDNVALVFFDAEDIGGIEGYNFSEGAEMYAKEYKTFVPDKVIVIDMIGGENAVYNLDFGALENETSRDMLLELWETGIKLNLPPFTNNRGMKGSYFICDHSPFYNRGIPSVLLIDITYKWWHTLEDKSKHCSEISLDAAAKVLIHFIYKHVT